MHRSTQSFLSCWALHKILHRSTQSFLSCWALHKILHRTTQSFLSCWALHKILHRTTQRFLSCWALHKILHRTTQSFLSCWALHKILIPGNQRQETLIARAMGIIRAEQETCSGQEGRRMLLQKGIDRFFQGSKNFEIHKAMWRMCVALICVSLSL